MLRLSYSQIKLFKTCKRNYYYRYVLKLKEKNIETKWMNFGSAMHKVLEDYYNDTNINYQQNMIEQWKIFKLDGRMDFNSFRVHVLNGIALQLKVTDVEEKFFFRVKDYQIVGYGDIINNKTGLILDWKSGTYSKFKADDYKNQLKYYAYFFYRKYNKLPSECSLFFNKKSKRVSFTFSKSDIKEVEEEIIQVGDEITYMKATLKKSHDWVQNIKSCFFCGYKRACLENSTELKFHIVIKNNFCFLEGDVTPLLVEGIDRELKFDLNNKYWIMKQVLAKSNGVPPNNYDDIGTKHLFDKIHRMFGFGHLNKIKEILKQYAEYYDKILNLEVEDLRDKDVLNSKLDIMPDKLITDKIFRPYQIEAIESFIYHNGLGIFEIATGGGKTLIASELIRMVDTNTLWIIDRKELLYQTKDVLEKLFGFEIGLIGDSVNKPLGITIATVQTLSQDIPRFKSFLNKVNFIVVDEFHKSAAESYQKIFKELRNTKYRLGISGTVYRDDGNTPVLFSLIGEVIYKKSATELEILGYLMKPEIKFLELEQRGSWVGTYPEVYESVIVDNIERNNIIYGLTKKYLEEGKKILILTNRVAHGEKLLKLFEFNKINVYFIHGSVNNIARKEKFQDFRDNKLMILIGTISIFSEGIDLPDLDVIINASANKGEVKTIQSLGRILRKHETKERAIYIDFIDNSKFLKKASKSRIETFKKEGHKVKIAKYQDM